MKIFEWATNKVSEKRRKRKKEREKGHSQQGCKSDPLVRSEIRTLG